jgi:hypothetical protein
MAFLIQNKAKIGKILIISLVYEKNAIFCRKLTKIAENCDHNIDPWSNWASKLIKFWTSEFRAKKRSSKSRLALNSCKYVSEPGSNPTKHDFPNFTHICKKTLQICVKIITNLWKINPTKLLQIFVSLILPILQILFKK